MSLEAVKTDPATGEVSIPDDWVVISGTQQSYCATPGGEIIRLPRVVKTVRMGKQVTRRYNARVVAQQNRGGHLVVELALEGDSYVQRVNRLVCTSFHGPPPGIGQDHVVHLDGDYANNRPENLRWGFAKELAT